MLAYKVEGNPTMMVHARFVASLRRFHFHTFFFYVVEHVTYGNGLAYYKHLIQSKTYGLWRNFLPGPSTGDAKTKSEILTSDIDPVEHFEIP